MNKTISRCIFLVLVFPFYSCVAQIKCLTNSDFEKSKIAQGYRCEDSLCIERVVFGERNMTTKFLNGKVNLKKKQYDIHVKIFDNNFNTMEPLPYAIVFLGKFDGKKIKIIEFLSDTTPNGEYKGKFVADEETIFGIMHVGHVVQLYKVGEILKSL